MRHKTRNRRLYKDINNSIKPSRHVDKDKPFVNVAKLLKSDYFRHFKSFSLACGEIRPCSFIKNIISRCVLPNKGKFEKNVYYIYMHPYA